MSINTNATACWPREQSRQPRSRHVCVCRTDTEQKWSPGTDMRVSAGQTQSRNDSTQRRGQSVAGAGESALWTGEVSWIPNSPAWLSCLDWYECPGPSWSWAVCNLHDCIWQTWSLIKTNQDRVRLEVRNKTVNALEKISFHLGVQVYQTRTPKS